MMSVICLFLLPVTAFSGPITHVKAKAFLKKTNECVFKAKDEIVVHKVYNGDFTKAVLYEREAKKMFNQQKYKKAVELSFISRFYANRSINKNAGGDKKFITTLSPEEQRIVIDDTSAGFWQASKTGQEGQLTNKDFVANAIRDRIPFDYINADVNKDQELSTKPLLIAID